MRAIKEELGDNDDDEDDLVALERKMQSAGMPSNVWKHVQRELRYDIFGKIMINTNNHTWVDQFSYTKQHEVDIWKKDLVAGKYGIFYGKYIIKC